MTDRHTTEPRSWLEPPDDVDIIQAQERFEQTDDFMDAALDWAINDEDCIADMVARFVATSSPYDRAFDEWMQRGGQ